MCGVRGRVALRRSEEEVKEIVMSIANASAIARSHKTMKRHSFLLSLAGMAVASIFAVPAIAQQKAAAPKTFALPKTPWGDPDLQGTWTSDDCIGTPMNRPANL